MADLLSIYLFVAGFVVLITLALIPMTSNEVTQLLIVAVFWPIWAPLYTLVLLINFIRERKAIHGK